MKRLIVMTTGLTGLLLAGAVSAGDKNAMIADAERAGPPSVTANATFKAPDGTVLREGSNGYTCYPDQDAIGPMCNPEEWDKLMGALMSKSDYSPSQFSISYMLHGDNRESQGVSNSDPYHPDPASADDFIIEGPHLMILVPDKSMLEGMSRDPNDPVYVMWGDTPYAHIMVKIEN
jgi:hypothetical protein